MAKLANFGDDLTVPHQPALFLVLHHDIAGEP
jgi:hypothetical protein